MCSYEQAISEAREEVHREEMKKEIRRIVENGFEDIIQDDEYSNAMKKSFCVESMTEYLELVFTRNKSLTLDQKVFLCQFGEGYKKFIREDK